MKNKYKTLITSCWIVLFICFIVKILGGNFFEIVCDNKYIIKLCDFIGNNIIAYYLYCMILYVTSNTLVVLAILGLKINKDNKYKLLILVGSLFLFHLLKFIVFDYFPYITLIEMVFIILLPLIIDKTKLIHSIFGYILCMLFQIISLVIKNIGLVTIDENILISFIYMIDYYIMIILYYLYSIKEGGILNGKTWIRLVSRRKRQRNC